MNKIEAMKRASGGAAPTEPTPARRVFAFTPDRLEAIEKARDGLDRVGGLARLKLLYALECLGEADVTTLGSACGLSSSGVSQELKKLKDGGMVAVRPEAQARIYRRLPHPVADFALALTTANVPLGLVEV